MKILVIQLSRFGDALQTTPMLHALRRRYPQAYITVLSRYNVMEVYKDNPDVDFVELFHIEEFSKRLVENPEKIFEHYLEVKNAVTRLESMRFDLVINVTHDRFSTFLSYLLNAPETEGMIVSKSKRPQILINGFWFRYLKCTSEVRKTAAFNLADIYKNAAGSDTNVRNLFFFSSSDSMAEAKHLLNGGREENDQRYIAFQMGASMQGRCWPTKHFAALGDMLCREKGIHVVFLGSHNEKWMGEEVAKLMAAKPIDLIGKTDLPVLAAVLKQCALLVTNDTGTMHLAEAVGTKCVALFFESANPFQTGPYGEGHIICSPELDCFPCSTNADCPDKRCLETIPVHAVYELTLYKLGENMSQTIIPPEKGRIYQTSFSKTGTFDARPLTKARLDKVDFIRRVCRSMWLKYAHKSEIGFCEETNSQLQTILAEEFKEWTTQYRIENEFVQDWLYEAKNDLDALTENVDRGAALLEEVGTVLSSSSFDGALVCTKSNEIGLSDQQIMRLGKSSPWISEIASMFNIELEQAKDDHFFTLFETWQKAYGALKLRGNLLKEEINLAGRLLMT